MKKRTWFNFFRFMRKDFEAELKKAGLPVELKYLPPAMSALNSNAVGNEKRAGVWQLLHFQAFLNDGEVNRLVDERLDVLLSTKLAIRQLKQNLKIYKNTELAILAFLAGNTAVKNAIYFAGENAEVDEILHHLPENFADQIAAFQAMAVFLSANRFVPETSAFQKKNFPDTVRVYRQLHFKQIEKVLEIPVAQIQDLNPEYKFSIVPGKCKRQKSCSSQRQKS